MNRYENVAPSRPGFYLSRNFDCPIHNRWLPHPFRVFCERVGNSRTSHRSKRQIATLLPPWFPEDFPRRSKGQPQRKKARASLIIYSTRIATQKTDNQGRTEKFIQDQQ